MCGLVSIIARKPAGLNGRDLDLFEQMLMIDTLRGKDSTGVMTTINHSKEVRIVKTAQEPFLMFRTKQWADWRMAAIGNGRYVAGHNRAATRGTINNDNAHPFVENNIVLMHNGTLTETSNLTKEKVDVDSHAIAHALSSGTPEEVIPTINGAFALIWYDTETEKLYATRNDQRPLSLITTGDFFFLASEAWMAAMPAQRQNRNIENIREVEAGELLEFDLQGRLTYKTLPKPKLFPLPGTSTEYEAWMRARGVHNGRHWSQWTDEELAGDDTPFEPGVSEVTPEIKNLRKALTAGAKSKTETSSNVCVLTSPSGSTSQKKETTSTSTTPNDSNVKSVGGTGGPTQMQAELERLEAAQRNIMTDNPEFKKGTVQLVKIWQMHTTANGRHKFTGKIMTPDKEMVDCQGFLPDNQGPGKWSEWMNEVTHGVVAWTTVTVGGPTVFIRDIQKSVYATIHGTEVPMAIWDHAVKSCQCKMCQAPVEQWERPYTSVRTKSQIIAGHTAPVNMVSVICPDCLMEKLPKGEIYDTFHRRYVTLRNAVYEARSNRYRADSTKKAIAAQASADCCPTVQEGESLSEGPLGTNESTVVVQGPATLQ